MSTTTNVSATCPRCGREVAQGAWTLSAAQAVLDGARPAFTCPNCGIFEPSEEDRIGLQAWVDHARVEQQVTLPNQ